jgi:hypothetical protein
MNDESTTTATAEPAPSETDLVALLKKLQQQLNFLEKKIDVLISQSQPKPFRDKASSSRPFQKRTFSKPSRSFDRPRPHGREEREQSPRDRDSARTHFYERFKPAKKRAANPKRKPFSPRREDRE